MSFFAGLYSLNLDITLVFLHQLSRAVNILAALLAGSK
jgi:hypothetical protein